MSGERESAPPLPRTVVEWEAALTARFLRATEDGDAAPIRSIEVTPETLAAAAGASEDRSKEAEDAFRRAVLSDPGTVRSLTSGRHLVPTTQTPNCLVPLALSLLVDSLMDEDYVDQGQYRAKLRSWLHLNRTFSDLSGIASMWRDLVTWLDERVEDGAPFRRLILPEPPVTWAHIGYTRYLSFPTRRDLRLLEAVLRRDPSLANDPPRLVRALDARLSTQGSWGLHAAFEEFKTAFRASQASRGHRFWRLVIRAGTTVGAPALKDVTLRLEVDQDGGDLVMVRGDGEPIAFPTIGAAVRHPSVVRGGTLAAGVARGLLFLRRTGMASWTAEVDLPRGREPILLAISEVHMRLAAGALARFRESGEWRVTMDPVGPATVADILARLRLKAAIKERLSDASPIGGVRVGTAWLGQPSYLPGFDADDDNVAVRSLGDGPNLGFSNGRLTGDRAPAGDYLVEDRAAGWSRRLRFCPEAAPHNSLDCAARNLPLDGEWIRSAPGGSLPSRLPAELVWDPDPGPAVELVEALYAAGRSGLSEGDALELISAVADRQSWAVLRGLQESTFLEARRRSQWRGRVWTLGEPKLVRSGADFIVVSGALPAALEREFCEVALGCGARPFRRIPTSPFSPPLLGASGGVPVRIGERLGWAVADCSEPPVGAASDALERSPLVGSFHEAASWWDWSSGGFSGWPQPVGEVSLTRFQHPGRRDHDIYRISVAGSPVAAHATRAAAIVHAYVIAKRAMFRFDGEALVRLTRDGALPLELAAALRLRTLANPGVGEEGYSYPCSPADALWLAGLAPGLIEGVIAPAANRPATPWPLALRGRGARRAQWIQGELVG
jgi:hypothetical protein